MRERTLALMGCDMYEAGGTNSCGMLVHMGGMGHLHGTATKARCGKGRSGCSM